MQELIDPHFLVSLVIGLVGLTRILTFVSFAVFLGPSVSMAVKMPLCIALYLPLHPLIAWQVEHFSVDSFLLTKSLGLDEAFGVVTSAASSAQTLGTSLLSLVSNHGFNVQTALVFTVIFLKEAFVGFLLAFFSSLLFYALMSAGILIDNTRGATAAQENEYLSQESSSPTGTIFLLSATTLFFSTGGFMALVGLIYLSYVAWPVVEPIPFIFDKSFSYFNGNLINEFASLMLLVAAPFLLVSLLCDIALGIMNRFAPQLNVFILAMPIKSAVAAFLLIVYLSPLYEHMRGLFMTLRATLINLLRSTGKI